MPKAAPDVIEPPVATEEKYPTVKVSRLALREANRKKPVYGMHKWWARRLGTVFRMLLLTEGRHNANVDLWEDFYSPRRLPAGFTVLDPFLGGGTSLIEAHKLGATCVGVDIDPVACFVTKLELHDIDAGRLLERYEEISDAVSQKLLSLYRATVGGTQVDVIYYFWVDRVTCAACGEEGDGHPTYQIAHDRSKGRQVVVCPECGTLTETRLAFDSCRCSGCGCRVRLASVPIEHGRYRCASCGSSAPLRELYPKGLVKPRLFAHEYLAGKERGFAPVTKDDLALYERASESYAAAGAELIVPGAEIPAQGRSDRRPLLYGYRRYRELFNDRQLYCLGTLAKAVRDTAEPDTRAALALAFSHCLATNNMFCGYAFGYRRLTPLFSVHSFRKVSRPVEGNVWGLPVGRGSFSNTVRAVMEGASYMAAPYELKYGPRGGRTQVSVAVRPHPDSGAQQRVRILNRSSDDLAPIEDGSVDLILTDPPYYDNLAYSELSDFYHVWLRRVLPEYARETEQHTPMLGTLFAGPRKGEDRPEDAYKRTLSKVFRECHRVAKPGAKLVFTFHHRTPRAFACLGSGLLSSGFSIRRVFPVRSEGRSGFHSYEGSIKWDNVFICKRARVAKTRRVAGATLDEVLKQAATEAAAWRRRLRGAKLTFSAVDEKSLAHAFILREFSRLRLSPSQLDTALSCAAE